MPTKETLVQTQDVIDSINEAHAVAEDLVQRLGMPPNRQALETLLRVAFHTGFVQGLRTSRRIQEKTRYAMHV